MRRQIDMSVKKEALRALFGITTVHRRAEGPLPKGTVSEIPQISKLTTKAMKRDALVAALGRLASRPAGSNGHGQVVADEQVEDDVDSDVDMEMGLSQIWREEEGEHKTMQNRLVVETKHEQTARDQPVDCRCPYTLKM
ncbi:hypothetical protein DFH06DRAFT_1309068 [Mycena polygramma]|nr:hypothetical protein DFH06DRAFT_1309068 [Mycena polygramma]